MQPPAFAAGVLDQVRRVDGVKSAAGGIFSTARFVDEDGDPLSTSFAPEFVASVSPEPFETLTYTEGGRRGPRDEVGVDEADRRPRGPRPRGHVPHRRPGRRQGVQDHRHPAARGHRPRAASGTAELTLPEAQRLMQKQDRFDGISVEADDGVSREPAGAPHRRRAAFALPRRDRRAGGERQSQDIKDDLSFFRIVLLVVGGVALLVGSFLIFNTFAITVAQRIRELGLLRTLGATRGQVLTGMLLEATIIGALGSGLGVVAGLGFASGLSAVFKTLRDRPAQHRHGGGGAHGDRGAGRGDGRHARRRARPRAARHARLADGGAARGGAAGEPHPRPRVRGVRGAADADRDRHGVRGPVRELRLLRHRGRAGRRRRRRDAAGRVACSARGWCAPLASLAGWPLERLRGITGRLARENAVRKPGRTAVTAAALMIGLAVVVFVTVFAAGISASVSNAIDRNFQGDLVLQNSDGFSPISPGAGRAAQTVDGVQTVSSLTFAGAVWNGADIRVSAVDPTDVNDVLSLDWKQGSPSTLAGLTDGQVVVDDAWAKSNDLGVGDTVTVRTPLERVASFEIVGSVKDNADLLGNVVITESALRRTSASTTRASRSSTWPTARTPSGSRSGSSKSSSDASRRSTRSTSRSSRTARRSSCSSWSGSSTCCSHWRW